MKIFRSTILGNEETPPIGLESLPIQHQNFLDRVENLQTIIDNAEKILEKTKTELDNLQKSCKHYYFYDEEGYPYNYRYCATCKSYMGTI